MSQQLVLLKGNFVAYKQEVGKEYGEKDGIP